MTCVFVLRASRFPVLELGSWLSVVDFRCFAGNRCLENDFFSCFGGFCDKDCILGMEGRELRRGVTLSEQLSVVHSSNLGDLLKVREEDDMRICRRRGGDSVTLESIIACEKREGSTTSGGGGRTLLDIIHQEHEASGIMADGNSSNEAHWNSLRDRLRLHIDGVAWASASAGHLHPISDAELVVSVRNSELAVPEPTAASTTATATAAELPSVSGGGSNEINGSENSDRGGTAESSTPAAVPAAAAAEEEEEEQPARVSLLALLEQTDRQWGGSGRERLSLFAKVPPEKEVAADEREGGGGVMLYMCCVCMMRHKGAAFIPCGHTFCRLCSRELWVSRGSCPLCNAYIVEILDIF
ncbi:hypothetical protein BHM03_00011559 [Ensete ventricosum]|nr:hypothetical protein BHM03_00011559 [Ensete ventricosum]